MESRATGSDISASKLLELEKKLLHPDAEPISLPLSFMKSITRDFCDVLGSGGYGVVYKGIIQHNGLIVAVKKIHDIHLLEDNIQLFQKEVISLMRIRHQNIVKLLGYCAESRWETREVKKEKYVFAEIPARMLCFEYLSKEGLDKHLSDESSGLEWHTRYKIIKGICSGLNFLHECNIIHLDLKPQNILMDSTMMPKIADFGLSRLVGEQKSHTVTKSLAGSPGYMAPEYINNGVISKKADIFSLGVLIIEILRGCKDGYPDYHQSTQKDFQHFTKKVLSRWRKRFKRASEYTTLELHTQQVKQCIDIALQCVHPDKNKRPNVSYIIEILHEAEGSCNVQNGKDLLVDHQMGSQEGVPQDVQGKDRSSVAVNRSVVSVSTTEKRETVALFVPIRTLSGAAAAAATAMALARRVCTYMVQIKTSSSSPRKSTDVVSLAFGDAYGNEVYAEQVSPPGLGFQRGATEMFQITGPYGYGVCYLYLRRSGRARGWKPEWVRVYEPTSETPSTFYYGDEEELPDGVWYGFDRCRATDASSEPAGATAQEL